MPIQQYPASSGGGSAATTPVGASSLVFSALTGTGDYTYTGTITAGVYVFSGNSQDNSRIKISGSSFAAYTNGNDAPVYFNVPSTESSVNIGQAGVLGTNAWEGVNTNLNNHHLLSITRAQNNSYYMGDNAGQLLWSTDALNWSTILTANGNSNRWINQGYDMKLTEANGTFLIAAGESTSGQAMATSTDGVFWNEVDLSYLRGDITSLNMSSAQGVKWAHDRFFAFYTNSLTMWSTTGTSWYPMPEYQAHFRSISKAGTSGNWVATSINPSIYYSTDLVTWTSRNPVNQILNDIVWSTERSEFVAIGEQTRYAQSTDGITWQGGQFGGTTTMYSLAYGAGKYVTVGNSGHAYHSTDGISWSTAFINNVVNPGNQFNKIIFKNGKFITGDGAYLYQSTDGVTWGTASASPYLGYTQRVESNGDILSMAYGYSAYSKNGGASVETCPYAPFGGYRINKIYYSPSSGVKYFAACDGNIIMWSSTAVSWNQASPSGSRGDTYWKDINKGGTGTNDFVAVGTNGWITYSGNGTSWSSNYRADPVGQSDLNAVAFFSPYTIIAAESGTIAWATAPNNGPSSWTSIASLGGACKTLFAGSIIIAAGANGLMRTSTNGITWTSRNSGFGSTTIRHVSRQDTGVYVAVGDNGTMRQSTDAITWTTRLTGTTNKLLGVSPKSLSANQGTVVIGEQSTFLVNNDSGLTSYTQVPVGYLRNNISVYNRRIRVLNNNYFVSDSIGDVYISTNGTTWTNPLFTFGATNAMKYFNGTYLVGNDKGYLYTSTNLTTWTTRDAGFYNLTDQTSTNSLTDFIVGSSTVVAFGSSGKLSTSTNAVTWTTRTNPLTLSASLTAGIYYNNLFILTDGSGLIATSTDATTWTIRKSPLNAELFNKFTSDSTKVIGVTNTNNIYYSADGITWVAGSTAVQPSGSSSIVAGNSMFIVPANHATWASHQFATSLSGTYGDKTTYGYQFQQGIVDIDWSARDNAFLALGYTGMLMKQVPPVKAMPITGLLYSTNITKVN
jgi:hypothetical protein